MNKASSLIVICSLILSSPVLAQLSPTSPFKSNLFGKFNVEIDAVKQTGTGLPMIRYSVDMPQNTYLAFSYGLDMFNKDMVAFIASNSGVQV